ncbi:MAG: hypothetical protein JWM98_2636 [Thermoleophilia bacterium]|nr:hypothetical protein [Thermoleophilia bacterium]
MPDTVDEGGGPGRLHVCAVPIGNLDDASPRLRAVLGAVDVIACEDTRTTRRLLDLLGVAPVPRLLAHHGHNEAASATGVVALLVEGLDVALVSDAGSPAVSDPGVELVAAAHAAGVEVVAVPGPSAVAAALGVAGIGGSGYRFVGFLPRAAGELDELLERHAGDVVVAFESPHRLHRSLVAIASLQPERVVAACRELTKRHEQVARGTAAEVSARLPDPVKGELVLVLAPLPVAAIDADPRAVGLVLDLASEGLRVKAAAQVVARHLGGSARELFDAASSARSSD